jgi:hypothetical protein
LCSVAFGALSAGPAFASDDVDQNHPTLSRNTYGEVGILDTPTARMNRDGQIAVTGGILNKAQRINFTFQVLPWLEGSFRYSHLSDFGSTGQYYDRSFGMKMRLWQEGRILPQVSVGIRDLIGTGIYGTEYVVASKRFWDIDLSMGMGWGRFADQPAFRNPIGLVFQSFNHRTPFSGSGGQVQFGNFFHGPNVGLFGGAIWNTPIDGLDLMVEYSGDKYVREQATGNARWKMPLNFGVSYRPADMISLSAGWLYGTTWNATLTVSLDPTKPIFPFRVAIPPPLPVVRTAAQQQAALGHVINPDGPGYREVVSSPGQIALAQTLMSTVPDVHDFEVSGSTLLVDVILPGNTPINCKRYATAAYGVRPDLRSVAITNLSDPTGAVAMCETPAAVNDAQLVSLDLTGASTRSTNTLKLAEGGPSFALPQARAAAPDMAAVNQNLRKFAMVEGMHVEAAYFGIGEVVVYYENNKYYSEDDAAGRMARILMAVSPPGVEVFKLIVVDHGVPLRQFTIGRSALERVGTVVGGSTELGDAISFNYPSLNNPILDAGQDGTYPRFAWSLMPNIRQSLFDPDSPYQVQFFGTAEGAVQILPGLTAEGSIDVNFWNNFDTKRASNSQLPHVRSDINEYFEHGASGIETLMMGYRTRIAPDVFVLAKAGILEDMFTGAGGQVLWRPDQSRFAVGIDIYQVWQRGFDRLFDLQKYNVTTGHISVYYQSPWYGMNVAVHAGRYLAGDYGATFELTRRFESGVELGAFATFTNVPFSKFGEGSFDKGIILRMPLEWAVPIHTTKDFDLTVRSLSRDGGARLKHDDQLYDDTTRTSYGELIEHIDDVTNP